MELNYFVSYSLMDEHGVASSLCPTDNTAAHNTHIPGLYTPVYKSEPLKAGLLGQRAHAL